MNRVDLIAKFLEDSFDKSVYLSSELDSKKYRLEHSYRVANIGKQIAIEERLNVDALVIACLLHDISYTEAFKSQEDWINHGRKSAQISRSVVEKLDFDEETKNNILFGIAIHVDDKSDFEGEKNAFTLSVGDADNIDRFDAYRFYEMLKYNKFDSLSYDDQVKFVDEQILRFNKLLKNNFATPTVTRLFHEKIKFSLEFLSRLRLQLENSRDVK